MFLCPLNITVKDHGYLTDYVAKLNTYLHNKFIPYLNQYNVMDNQNVFCLENKPIVFNIGSCLLKAGFAGDLHPLAVFPAQGAFQPWTPEFFKNPDFIGSKINSNFPKSPPSIFLNEQSTTEVLAQRWKYVINKGLNTDVRAHPILIVAPPNYSISKRKEIANIFFDELHCPTLAFIDSARSSYFSIGRHTCFIVEISATRITTTPCKGLWRISDASMEMRPLKNNFNSVEECQKVMFADGTLDLDIDILFKNDMTGLFPQSISEFIIESINRCPVDTRVEFIHNIVLVGEYAKILGFDSRLTEELKQLTTGDQNYNIHVIQPSDIPLTAWIGGSISASLNSFDCWLTKEEYFEGDYHKKHLIPVESGFCYTETL